MSLERKIFLIDKEARPPSENLAMNNLFLRLIKEGKYDLIARIYCHTNGIILGNSESISDVYADTCCKQNFEIVRRLSGGSAIFATPDIVLCYSLFFNGMNLNINVNVTDVYKSITIPLAKKLGRDISVEGTYYLRVKRDGESIPFAGHAMKVYGRDIVHFDGVVNKTVFEIDILSRLIKLRELYSFDGENYIVVDGKAYTLSGKPIDKFNKSKAILLRSEKEELKKIIGLKEIGIEEDLFISILYDSLNDLFGGISRVDKIDIDSLELRKTSEEIKKDASHGRRSCLGHCFVDLLEPEPRIHYGI